MEKGKRSYFLFTLIYIFVFFGIVGGFGEDAFGKTKYFRTANADKLLFLFHGSGGSSDHYKKPEVQDLIAQAILLGFYIVVPESKDRIVKKWDTNPDHSENKDLEQIWSIYHELIFSGEIPFNAKVYASGTSQGGGFASLAAYSLEMDGVSLVSASGLYQIITLSDYVTPTVFIIGENDSPSQLEKAPEHFSILSNKGVRSEYYENENGEHGFEGKHNSTMLSFFLDLNSGPSLSYAQSLTSGPDNKDDVDGVAVDQDGNTYVGIDLVGTMMINGRERKSKGYRDIVVYKIDKSGKELWFKNFGTEDDEALYDITLDNVGHVVINGEQGIGAKVDGGNEAYNTRTLKIKAKTGRKIWDISFGSGGGNEVKADEHGNIYATFMSNVGLTIKNRFRIAKGGEVASYLIKINQAGEAQWFFKTNSSNRERIRAVGIGYNSTRILIGFEYWGGIGFEDQLYELENPTRESRGAFALLDSEGNLIDSGLVDSEGGSNVRAAGGYEGGLYFSGFFTGSTKIKGWEIDTQGESDTFLVKIGKDGRRKWIRTLGNASDEDGGELVVTPSGSVFLSGFHIGDDYSLFDQNQNKLASIFPLVLLQSAHWVNISDKGQLLKGETINQKYGSGAAGVLDYSSGHLSINVRIFGRAEINGNIYESTSERNKDAVVIRYEDL